MLISEICYKLTNGYCWGRVGGVGGGVDGGFYGGVSRLIEMKAQVDLGECDAVAGGGGVRGWGDRG